MATQDDLIARFGASALASLADRNGDGVNDPEVITQAFADADAEIEAHLARHYALPFVPVPPLIVSLACDLAWWQLHSTGAVPEDVTKRVEAARGLLRNLAAGRITLGTAAPSAQARSENLAESSAAPRMFSSRDRASSW